MNRIGSVALSLVLVAGVPAAALGAAHAKSKSPKPPAAGSYAIKNGTTIDSGSFKIVKKHKAYQVTKLTGVWSADQATTCGTGTFTMSPAQPITLVKDRSQKFWIVGPHLGGNGNPGNKVTVTNADSSTHTAKFAMIFASNIKPKPGQFSFKNTGTIRFTQGDCEGTFGFSASK